MQRSISREAALGPSACDGSRETRRSDASSDASDSEQTATGVRVQPVSARGE